MRVAYADPPYPGMSGFYKDHPDYAGEVDHAELVERLTRDFDGWILHTAAPTLQEVLAVCPPVRIGAWVKPFAAFKRGVGAQYAWEPVLFSGGRKRDTTERSIRDFIAEPMTMRRGLTGAKPDAVCRWAFGMLGMVPGDELVDLFPGSGAVTAAWEGFCAQGRLIDMDYSGHGARHETTEGMDV